MLQGPFHSTCRRIPSIALVVWITVIGEVPFIDWESFVQSRFSGFMRLSIRRSESFCVAGEKGHCFLLRAL